MATVKDRRIMRKMELLTRLVTGTVLCLLINTSYGHRSELSNWLKQTNISALACQGEYTNVLCQNYEGIRILDAFWGRDDNLICQSSDPLDKLTHKEMCYATDKDDAYNKVKQMCQEVQTCRVQASPLLFEDLCPRIRKYVRVTYECRQLSGMKRFNIVRKYQDKKSLIGKKGTH